MSTNCAETSPSEFLHSPLPAWSLSPDTTSLYPTSSFNHRLNEYLSKRQQDDLLIRCIFAPSFEAKPVYIHHSRLEYAGGRLQNLIAPSRNLDDEHIPQYIQLSDEHDPDTFALVRNFLYGMPIHVNDWTLSRVVKVIKIAEDWQLLDLVRNLCLMVERVHMVQTAEHVLEMMDVAALPGLPHAFRVYYWDQVARCFDQFGQSEQADTVVNVDEGQSISVEKRLCPRFAGLWPMAVAQYMAVETVRGILRYSKRANVRLGLMEVLLKYLEPRMYNDDVLCQLIMEVGLGMEQVSEMVMGKGMDNDCSARAVRLLARSVLTQSQSARCAFADWSCSWRKSVSVIGSTCTFKKKVSISYAKACEHTRGSGGDQKRPWQSMHFTVSKRGSRAHGFELKATWKVEGNQEIGEEQEIEVQIDVLDDFCKCTERVVEVEGSGDDKVWRTAKCRGKLAEDGNLSLNIPENEVRGFIVGHDDPNACSVTIVLTVRIVDGSVWGVKEGGS